jgi:hypothetical protein
MFSNKREKDNKTIEGAQQTTTNDEKTNSIQIGGNYYSMYTNDNSLNKAQTEMDPSEFDKLLENEKNTNSYQSWNKLDTVTKIKKLHVYSNDYGKQNSLSEEEINTLKQFFASSVRTNKLKKNKDIVYDIKTGIVTDVPGLFYSKLNKKYTIKNLDTKHVSTMKTYTPKRSSVKNKSKTIE